MKRQFRINRSRDAVRGEMRDEVEAHVALAAENLMRRGVEREEAQRRARQRFGDFEAAMTTLYRSVETREGMMRRRETLSAIRQDLTVSLRQMRRSPVVAVAITVTLALGIGANLVTFGIADRLLFSPPVGVVNAEALRLLNLPQGLDYSRSTMTNYATFMDLSKAESFASVGGFMLASPMSLGSGAKAELVTVTSASASFFPTLGVRPILGRFILPEEDQPPGGQPVAVIGAGFWQRKFGRDPSAIGSTLSIGGQAYRIVGVLPDHFTGIDIKPVDVWIPITTASLGITPDYLTDRRSKWMMIVARLKPGVPDERALADVDRLFTLANPGLTKDAVTKTAAFTSIKPASNAGNTEAAKVAIWLVGVAAMVLLIACANVTTLLLTRALRRTPELAVRLALGVSRSRLVAQLLGESAVLAILGGAVAVGAAYLSRGVIQSVLLPETDLGPVLSLPVIVLGAVVVLAISTLTSIAPALQVQRVDLTISLKGGAGSVSDHRNRLRAMLLVAQVAMSAMLLVGAGLFVKSLRNAEAKRLGIDMDRTLLAEVSLPSYDFEREKMFWETAVQRVRAIPGVENASLTVGIPLRFSLNGRFAVPGLPPEAMSEVYRYGADARFFSSVGARILKGRGISESDLKTTAPVAVINETLAKRMATVAEPMGQCIRIYRADSIPCATIVGIVENITRGGIKEAPSMQYYIPKSQWRARYSQAMVVRTQRGKGEQLIGPVRRAIQGVANDIAFPRVATYEQLHSPELKSWRLGATMFTLFGALAFIVSVVGLYGMLAYSVAQRQREFGIRTALGAQAADIVGIVLRNGVAVVSVGLALGLAAAAVAAKYVGPMLYDVESRDLMVYAGSAGIVMLVTLGIAAIPARRAATVRPTIALRSE